MRLAHDWVDERDLGERLAKLFMVRMAQSAEQGYVGGGMGQGAGGQCVELGG